jgi:hypothetical protein
MPHKDMPNVMHKQTVESSTDRQRNCLKELFNQRTPWVRHEENELHEEMVGLVDRNDDKSR